LYDKNNKIVWTNWQKKVKPNAQIPKYLLWDMDLNDFDWQKCQKIVVERVIERGKLEDFYTLFAMYGGMEGVRKIVKELHSLSPRTIAFAFAVFDFKKDELKCYKTQRLQLIPWDC
jgi:hypothetical protein